jgi:putative ABC transport system permease protein
MVGISAVLKKAKADILSRPMISLLIVVTVITSSTLLTLALATLMNLSAPYARAFEDLNGAHVWLYLDRALVGQRDVEKIESLPGIVQSTGLRHYVTTRADLRDNQVAISLRALPPEMPQVNQLLIQEGRYLRSHQAELLASKDLDDLFKLSVGETLSVTRSDGQAVDLPVIGLAYNPMWDTYRTDHPPFVYVSEETLRELYPDESSWGWSIGLRLADPQSVDHIVQRVESALHADVVKSYTDWRDVQESAVFGAKINFIFLGAFGLFATLATVLVVASSIGSIVLSQFKQIGILKALGFTRHQILWLYLVEYLILAIIGSPIGLAAGIALSPLPLRNVAVSLNTTFRPPLNVSLIALVLSIVPGVVVAATLGAAYRGARAHIIKSIAIGAEAPHEKPSWGIRLATKLGLPIVLAMGMNDLAAQPLRSLMTGFNLTLGVIGIVFGLTLNDTLNAYRTQPALMGLVHDAMVTRRRTSDGKTRHLLTRSSDVEAFYSEALLDAESQQGQSFQVRAVEGDLDAFPFRIQKGRFFQPNTFEAIAGRGLLDWLGLEIGDELTLTFDGHSNRPVTWRIVGQYPEPTNEGEMMMVSLPAAAQRVRQVEPDTYFLKLTDSHRTADLKRYLKDNSADDLNVMLIQQAIPDDVVYLQLAIFALAVILIGIALINVFNTSLLAMQEKTRDIGILKTLGMTPTQVLAMVNTSAGCLGLIAALVGIPLGFALTKSMLASLSQTYGFGSVHVALNVLYIGLLIPLAVLVSMAGSILPGRRAASLSIVSVLRRE